MQVRADEVAPLARRDFARARSALPAALVFGLLVLVALQRGGYYAESWALPTVGCGWLVAVVALVGARQRLRRLELVHLAGLGLLASLALISASWAPGGLGSALPQTQLVALDLGAVCAVLIVFRRATPLVVAVWAALATGSLASLGTRLFPADAVELRQSERQPPVRADRVLEQPGPVVGHGALSEHRPAVAGSAALAAGTRGRQHGAMRGIAVLHVLARGVGRARGRTGRGDRRRPSSTRIAGLARPDRSLAGRGDPARVTRACDDERQPGARGRPQRRAPARPVLRRAVLGAALATVAFAQAEHRWTAPNVARRAFAGAIVAVCVLGLLAGMSALRGAVDDRRAGSAQVRRASREKTADLNARLFDASGSFRVDLWRVAWEDAGQPSGRQLRGRGYAPSGTAIVRSPSMRRTRHQLYLETLAELGPLGLACLLVALGVPLVGGLAGTPAPARRGRDRRLRCISRTRSGRLGLATHGPRLAALSCGAALLVMARGSRSASPSARSRGALALAGVALACFGLWSLYGNKPLGQSRDAIEAGQWAAAENAATEAVARVGGSSSLPWRLLGEAQTALRKQEASRLAAIAVKRDPPRGTPGTDLATVARGAERRAAARREALTLDPRGPETRSLARVVGILPSRP